MVASNSVHATPAATATSAWLPDVEGAPGGEGASAGSGKKIAIDIRSVLLDPTSPFYKFAKQLNEADLNGDGEITLPELIQLFRRLSKGERKARLMKALAILMLVAVVLIVAVVGGITFWLLQITKEAKVQNSAFLVATGQTNTGAPNQAVLVGKPQANFTLDTAIATKTIRRVLLAAMTANASSPDPLVAFGTAPRGVFVRACDAYNQGHLTMSVNVELTQPAIKEIEEVKVTRVSGVGG
eukprot:tig00000449_g931.t1